MGRVILRALAAAACAVAAALPPPAAAVDFPIWQKGVIAVPPSTTGKTYYVDGARGANTNNGTTAATAFKTIAKAVSLIAAGDTVLIRAGLYREGINLSGPSGTAIAPLTFGSYGDGEVILDGSTKVGGWVNQSGTVWRAPVAFNPIGIVVNEVPLKQVRQGQGGSTAPQEGLAGVTSGSGKWFVGGGFLTADFGTTIGAADPNLADIVVPNNNGAQQHVFWFGVSYVTFKGLTVRGSGSNGLWGYGSHVTVDSCDIKFNGKAAVSFLSSVGTPNSDNAVLLSHAYHNVLINWPRGNNGFAESGGGWPGTVVWDTNLRPVARGNLVHMNGGEGIISYGTVTGLSSGSALFEQNVAYDNWSVNMYFDNQPNDVARNNFLFNHPPDPSSFLYVGTTFPYDSLQKYTVCMMLADEQNSSDSTNGFANLRGTQVYNNLFAGCRITIRDYSEGTSAIANHGLKDTVIMNNTFVMPFNTFSNAQTYGIYLQNNGTRNINSFIENNIVYGFNNDPLFYSEKNGPVAGVTINFNDYFSTSATPFLAGFSTLVPMTFAQWKAAITGADTLSVFADPLLQNVAAYRGATTPVYDSNGARIGTASPAHAAGTATGAPSIDFSLASRPTPPSIGAYEPAPNPPRLGNISTRMPVLTGGNVMIAGFIIGGTANKTVAVTATGPSLAAFGIANFLANPTLQLVRQADGVTLATNDDWQTDANAGLLQSAGFAPASPLEAGLYVSLPPGAYTAIVSGAGGGTGVSVVGVFEVDHPEIPLVNISTRGFVQTGGNVMIGGFIIQGIGSQKVAVTATGPSLAPFGITNYLPNPTLQIVRSADGVTIATNDDWQTDANAAQLLASGFAPGNPLEPGLLLTLPPGAYTAIVSGMGGTTGVSVIGAFTVP